MANFDVNDIFKKLGIGNQTYENSPLDMQAPDDAPINKVPAMEADPTDYEPAEEDNDLLERSVASKALPLSKSDADKIKALPGSEMDRVPQSEAKPIPEPADVPESPTANPLSAASKAGAIDAESVTQVKPNYQEDILKAYQELKDAQKMNKINSGITGMLGASSKFGRALAGKMGAKYDDNGNAATMAQMRAMDAAPMEQAAAKIKGAEATMGAASKAEMVDPKSDISKFTREQAYATLKKLRPDSDFSGKLDNMSAEQLQKLPGMKNIGASAPSPWIATDRVDEKGNPVRFNKQTGTYSLADGSEIMPGSATYRDILRRDQLTGNYGIGNAQGMKVLPTTQGANIDTKGPAVAEGKPAQPKEVTYGEFAKTAPELAKKLDKKIEEFNKDMKDSREVATSVTNLASKLKPGPNGEVDSGLLGGIQTQAAKMAGQKGVLTDQDLVKFAGAGGVEAKLKRIVDGTMFGDMSDEDIKFFKMFAKKMGKSLDEDVLNRSQLYTTQAKQMMETVAPGISDQNVQKILGVDKVAPVVQNKEASQQSDLVEIVGPTGQKAKMTKENAKKYLSKPGYKLVGE